MPRAASVEALAPVTAEDEELAYILYDNIRSLYILRFSFCVLVSAGVARILGHLYI